MSSERIDIIVEDKVSTEPEKKIRALGEAAGTAHGKLNGLKAALAAINASAVRKLSEDMAKQATETARQGVAIERLAAAHARTEAAQARAAIQGAKLNTEQQRTALLIERVATETARGVAVQQRAAVATERMTAVSARNASHMEREGDAAVKLFGKIEKLREQQRAVNSQQAFNNQLGVVQSSSGTARSSAAVFLEDARAKEAAAKATEQLATRARALQSAVDPLFAAQVRYDRELAEANTLLAAGAITHTTHARAVALSKEGMDQATAASKRMTAQNGLNRFQLLTLQYTVNDVIASLASGASPMTILMQQGGQVTQAWGGLIPTLKAAGGALTSVYGIIGAGALVVGGIAAAAYLGGEEWRAYTKALNVSGNQAGATTQQLDTMAAHMRATANETQGASAAALVTFVGTSGVAAAQLERFTTLAIKWERETGVAVKKTAETFADLGKDPVSASLKLNETMNYLTASVYEQIKALYEQGSTVDAAKLAQSAYADAMAQKLPELTQNLGYLEVAWRAVGREGKAAWDAMLDIGRESDPAAGIRAKIDAIALKTAPGRGVFRTDKLDAEDLKTLGNLMDQLVVIEAIKNQNERIADSKRKQSEELKNQQAWDALALKAKTDEKKLEEDLDRIRKVGAKQVEAGLTTEREVNEVLKDRQAQYDKGHKTRRDTTGDTLAGITAAIQKQSEATDQQLDSNHKLSASDEFRLEVLKKLDLELAKRPQLIDAIVEAEALMYETQLKMVALEERRGAVKSAAYGIAESVKINKEESRRIDLLREAQKATADLVTATQDEAAAQAYEASTIGMASDARALALEQYRLKIELQSKLRDIENDKRFAGDEYGAQKKAIEDTIAAYAIKKQTATAKAVASEWEVGSAKIKGYLVDAFMESADDGLSVFERMMDDMKRTMKRQVIEFVINMGVNSVGQAFGFGGSGMAGAMGLGAGVSNAMGLSTLGGAAYQAFTGASAGSSGLAMGYANTVGMAGGDSLGALIAANGEWAGVAAGTAGTASGIGAGAAGAYTTAAADSALAYTAAAEVGGATAAGGGAAAGATTGLAAIPVWGWVALAVIAIAAMAQGGETRLGGQYTLDDLTGKAKFREGPSGGPIEDSTVRQEIEGTAAGINDLFKAMGSTAALTGFQAGLESSDNGRGGVYSGGTLNSGATFGESGIGNNYEGTLFERTSTQSPDTKEAAKNFTTDLFQSVVQATQAAAADAALGVPKIIADMVKGVDAEGLSDDAAKALVTQIATTVQAVNGFRDILKTLPFDALKTLSFDAAVGLVNAAGGLDKLSVGLSNYYDNFYSDTEKFETTAKNINKQFRDLGLPMMDLSKTALDTTDEIDAMKYAFRQLVETSMKDTTEEGQKTTVALLNLSGTIGGLADNAAKAAHDIDAVAQNLAELTNARTHAENIAKLAWDGVVDAFGKASTKAQDEYDKIIDGLDKQEKILTDAYNAAVAKQKDIKEAASDTRQTLLKGLAEERKAAAKVYKDAVEDIADERKAAVTAFKVAITALDKSIDAAQKSVELLADLDQSLQGAMDFFKKNDKSLLARETGQAQLRSALVEAQAGRFPTAASIADALAAVTQPSDQFFSNSVDYYRDYYKTAITISKLGTLTSNQLSIDQQMLTSLEDSKVLVQTNHEDHMARLDAEKEALDLQNETLKELFDQREDAINKTYEDTVSAADLELQRLQDKYKLDMDSLDQQRLSAKATLDDVTSLLSEQLAEAKKTYDAIMGIATPLADIAAALGRLDEALANFKQADAVYDVVKVATGNANISSTDITQFVKDAIAASTDTVGNDAVAALYQYAVANGLSTNQIAGSGANPLLTKANLDAYADAHNVTRLDDILTANGPAQQDLLDTATVEAANLVVEAGPIGRVKDFMATLAGHEFWQRDLYDFATTNHISSGDVDAALGAAPGTVNTWARGNGLPEFEVGTNYVPYDMTARIHEGEAIVPKSFNPAAWDQDSGMVALADEIRYLVRELTDARTQTEQLLTRISNNTAKGKDAIERQNVIGVPPYTGA